MPWAWMVVSAALSAALGGPAVRLGLAMRRRAARRRAPRAFEAYLRVLTGSVPHVPSAGISGFAVVEDRRLSFLDTRVDGLLVEGPIDESREAHGRERRRLWPLAVVLPLRLAGGVEAELAVSRRDEALVRESLGLGPRPTP